jgi:hypothetical protein
MTRALAAIAVPRTGSSCHARRRRHLVVPVGHPSRHEFVPAADLSVTYDPRQPVVTHRSRTLSKPTTRP